MPLDKACALHEHTARPTGRVEDAAVVGLNDLDDEADDGSGGEELAAALALAHGELAEEIRDGILGRFEPGIGTQFVGGVPEAFFDFGVVGRHAQSLSVCGVVRIVLEHKEKSAAPLTMGVLYARIPAPGQPTVLVTASDWSEARGDSPCSFPRQFQYSGFLPGSQYFQPRKPGNAKPPQPLQSGRPFRRHSGAHSACAHLGHVGRGRCGDLRGRAERGRIE